MMLVNNVYQVSIIKCNISLFLGLFLHLTCILSCSIVQRCFDVFQPKFLWGIFCIFPYICKAPCVPIALHTNKTAYENECSNALVAELAL